jgi:type IV pilus assembly protein PilF
MKQVQHIMDKYLVKKRAVFTTAVLSASVLLSTVLSGCVTQDYENDKTPVVQNQANRDDMAATRVSLGLGYLIMGNMPQAKQNLEKAKNFAPGMVQVYTAFAHYYETVGEHQLTVESYEKALSLKSDDADTLNNYGVYLCRQNQVEAAEKQFLKAIAVPSYVLVSKSYENLSSCFLQKDDFSKAEAYLNKAIAHNPSSASTLFQMVRLQYAMGDYKQAKEFEQRFEKMTRRFTPQSLALAYKVHLKLGQRRTAKNYGSMLIKMYPQSWESQQYLLNELELIEADILAKRFQLTKVSTQPAKSKKRVVKLSPKKALPVNAEPKVAAQTQGTVVITEKDSISTSFPTVKTGAISTATSASINAALTTTTVEAITAVPDLKNTNLNPSEAEIEVKTSTIAEESAQSKQVVVLSAPAVAQAEKIADVSLVKKAPLEEVNTVAVKEADAKTAAVVAATNIQAAKEEIPLEDIEIFHVAKKPAPIVEDAPKEIVAIKVIAKTVVNKSPKPVQEEPKPVKKEPVQKSEKETKKFPDFHVVRAGDTLYSISVKYNIKIKALRKWNKISKKKNIHIKDIIFLENPKSVNQ